VLAPHREHSGVVKGPSGALFFLPVQPGIRRAFSFSWIKLKPAFASVSSTPAASGAMLEPEVLLCGRRSGELLSTCTSAAKATDESAGPRHHRSDLEHITTGEDLFSPPEAAATTTPRTESTHELESTNMDPPIFHSIFRSTSEIQSAADVTITVAAPCLLGDRRRRDWLQSRSGPGFHVDRKLSGKLADPCWWIPSSVCSRARA